MKNIFICGDVNSKKEELLKAFIEIYSVKNKILLVDPKKIEFEEYKNISYNGEIIYTLEDFVKTFETFLLVKGKKFIIMNEIADFIYDDEYKITDIITNILNGSYDCNFIICTQRSIPSYGNKLDLIIKNNNIIKFIL